MGRGLSCGEWDCGRPERKEGSCYCRQGVGGAHPAMQQMVTAFLFVNREQAFSHPPSKDLLSRVERSKTAKLDHSWAMGSRVYDPGERGNRETCLKGRAALGEEDSCSQKKERREQLTPTAGLTAGI